MTCNSCKVSTSILEYRKCSYCKKDYCSMCIKKCSYCNYDVCINDCKTLEINMDHELIRKCIECENHYYCTSILKKWLRSWF